ncbi:MazG-like family protein [Fonticella tunisiensis]|uniref:MazG-like nucleotide pyrophosphohydrolase family protein n=1 Tax=Fonticella tunisiensis TaxID=1096341 RepID=A0A4R7KBK4_9CLOT|nr:MazG-like family protein [Fonticella tunisiensis]TDT50470.1 MazG-like nucleotide pyrophosphohydrolase family protein [Fonticella tunisiensis]
MFNGEDFDIMGNIKLIESYKTFLLSSVADLFTSMARGNKTSMDEITDELSEIIILSYLLGKRLGINYNAIDERIIKKLKLGLLEDNSVEKEYQDYSKLISYIRDARDL